MIKKNLFKYILCGLSGGFLNGLFGSGGGVLAVLFLRAIIGDEVKAHATSTAVIFLTSIASLIFYLSGGADIGSALKFLPGGCAGAVAGALILKKIEPQKLRRLFGAAMAVSGAVMLLS